MKYLLFSDLHAHCWQEFATTVEYEGRMLNSRFVDALKVLDFVAEQADKDKIEAVIFAGDLFHRKRQMDVVYLNLIYDKLARIAGDHIFYMLVGNHDFATNAGDHALHVLSGLNIYITPSFLLTPGGRVGLIAYHPDNVVIKERLAKVKALNPELIVMHSGILGAKVGELEYQPNEPLAPKDLPRIPVLSGHYHAPQTVSVDPLVEYIGSPMEFVRGEQHDTSRGLVIYDTKKQTLKRVPFNGPRFLTLTMDDDPKQMAGNYVDLIIPSGTSVKEAVADAFKHGARGVKPLPEPQDRPKRVRMVVAGDDKRLPTLPEVCEAYMKQHPAKGLSPSLLQQVLNKCLVGG